MGICNSRALALMAVLTQCAIVLLAPMPQLYAQETKGKGTRARVRVFDKRHRSYIPMDLEDAMDELDRTINPKDKERIQTSKEDSVMYHHGFGTGLRNGWGLWGGSRLARWFDERGIFHPDDMSGIILEAWFNRLRGKPFDFDEKVRGYQEYWRRSQEAQKEEEARAEKARKRIPEMMMGIESPGKPSEWASLPVRKSMSGVRVRSMVPFRDGVLLTERKTIWAKGKGEDYSYTPPLFFNPKTRTLGPLQCPEFDRIENAVVLGETMVLEGVKASKHRILVIGPDGRTEIPMPPGKGWIRLGSNGNRLVAVFSKSVWEWEGKTWKTLGQPKDDLPWCGMPPLVRGDYLYLRDEGQHEDNKSLHWLKLTGDGSFTTFHTDTGVVCSEGPRWEFVWSFPFTASGDQWIATGDSYSSGSLLRRRPNGSYQIVMINGEFTFSGDLLGSRKASDSLDFQAVLPLKEGALLLAGNQGIYRLEGNRMAPILGLKRTHQSVFSNGAPTDPDPKDRGNWNLDPSHICPLGPTSYLLGSDWEGVYLLDRTDKGTWEVTCLDEPVGSPVIF